MDKNWVLPQCVYWLISQKDESARFATKWPESSRVSTFAKVHDQMPLFFARAKGPTISANRDMRNSNRKLINVHDAKRVVNLSKNFPATPFKMKVWLLFYKVVFSGVCNVQMTANARRKIVICESPFCPVSLRQDGAFWVLSKGGTNMSFFKSELPKYIHHDLKKCLWNNSSEAI